MDNQALKDALVAAQTALVEKIGKQPYIELDLTLGQDGKWQCGGAYPDRDMNTRFDGKLCDTPADAIESFMQLVRDLPSPEQRHLREFHRKVADAIDFGNEHGIEAQWLNPLVETARALSSNAITKG